MGTSESIAKALTTGQQTNQHHKELQKKKFTALKALHQPALCGPLTQKSCHQNEVHLLVKEEKTSFSIQF